MFWPPEPDELYWRAIVKNHGGPDPLGRRPRRVDDVLSLKGRVEVVNLERDMRNSANDFGNWTSGLEAHPFDAVRTRAEAGDEEAKWLQVHFVGPDFVGRNADVVKAPAKFLNDGRRFMIQPASGGESARQGGRQVRHGHLFVGNVGGPS